MKTILSYILLFLLITQNSFAVSYSVSLGSGEPGAIPYESSASFPLLAAAGAVAVDKSTNELYVFDGNTASWVLASGGGGGGSVNSVGATAPVASTGGANPVISMPAATGSANGYLTSADFTTFNNKEPAITAGTSAQYYRGDKTMQNLDTGAVPENGNLYYTAARFNTAFGGKSTTDLAEGTNLYYTSGRFAADLATKNTSDLAEGTNLYFTNARAKSAAVNDAIVNGVMDVAPSQNAVFDALALKQDSLGYTAEDVANKDTDGTLAANSDTKYPSQKAVKTYADTKEPLIGYTTENVANKDTDPTLAANSDTKYASQKATKAYADAIGATAAANSWQITGNASTGGTGKIGTTDAQPFSIITNNANLLTFNGRTVSGTVSQVPVDATGVNQFDWRTYLDPNISTDGASHTGFNNQVVWDNGNLGYGNINGSILGGSFNFTHNGDGSINYASALSTSGYFNNTGTTAQYKGLTSESSISNGSTVSDFYGIVSGLNTTGGIVPSSTSVSAYANFTDGSIGQHNGLNQSASFSGTNTNSQGATGLNSYLQFNDSANTAGGLQGVASGIDLNDTSSTTGITGLNFFGNVRDSAAAGNINMVSVGLNQQDAATSTGTNGFNANLQYTGTAAAAAVNIANLYVKTTDNADLDAITGINTNPEIEGSSTVDNYNGMNIGGQIRGNSTVTNANGGYVNPQISGNAAVTNFTGLTVNPQVNGSATLTNGLTGLRVQPQGTVALNGVTGINIDMGSVVLDSAYIASGGQKKAITVNDGGLEVGYNYTVPGASSFFQNHYLGGTATVANGDPTAAFGFGTNLAQTVALHDDWSLDASGLGYVDVGFVGALNFDSGKTMARWTGALGGAGNPGGAGTLTDAIMFRAAGILPQGGSLTVDNMYGFQVDPNLFGILGTNKWGFYENGSGIENAMNRLAIGTSNQKVSNSDTALEIGNSRAFLNGRGTTTVKNALTPIAGMQFYDTTLNELQWYDGSSWIPAMAGAGAVTSVNGNTGAVVLDTDDISEGATNLYYTASRFNTAFGGKSTTDLAEGSNLYFTDARAIAAPLTGYISGAGTVSATDSVLQAVQKLNGNIATKQNSFTDIQEIATGTVDNSNVTFTLSQTPSSNASVELFLGGLILYQGSEYTISGNTITMATAPNFGQTLYAKYRY